MDDEIPPDTAHAVSILILKDIIIVSVIRIDS